MTPDQIASIVTQLPMVAILLWIFMQQTNNHQKSVDYYRARLEKFETWFMERDKAEVVNEKEKA